MKHHFLKLDIRKKLRMIKIRLDQRHQRAKMLNTDETDASNTDLSKTKIRLNQLANKQNTEN